MTENRITMRKLLEILQMRFGSQLNFRQISRSVRVSVGTVSNYVKAFQESELSWPLAEDISEPEVHQELKRKEATKQQLWEEYCQAHPLNAYSYAQYCHRYNQWRGCQKRSMRQLHNAGERLLVDYAGPTMPQQFPLTTSLSPNKLIIQMTIFQG